MARAVTEGRGRELVVSSGTRGLRADANDRVVDTEVAGMKVDELLRRRQEAILAY